MIAVAALVLVCGVVVLVSVAFGYFLGATRNRNDN